MDNQENTLMQNSNEIYYAPVEGETAMNLELKNDVNLLANFINNFCTVNTIGMSLNQYQDYVLIKQIIK